MPPIKGAATEFLAHKRVAVAGVSREPKGHGNNVVYKRLRQRGGEVLRSTRTRAVRATALEHGGEMKLARPAWSMTRSVSLEGDRPLDAGST